MSDGLRHTRQSDGENGGFLAGSGPEMAMVAAPHSCFWSVQPGARPSALR